MKKIICCAIYVFCLYTADVGGAINQRPSNAATSVGGHTFFNCTSDVPVAVTWLYSIGCTGAVGSPLTVNNCDIHSNYTSNFKTEKPDGSTCNLVISSASLSLGGCYTCFAGVGTGNIYQGMLIIIDSSDSVAINGTEWVSGEDVVISSSVSYRGPSIPQQPIPLPPSFYWTLQSETNQNITSYPGETTDTSASSYIIVTAQPPEIPPYESHIFFNLPVHIPEGCASNAPTYTDDTVLPPYPVSYPPQNVYIAGYPTTCLLDDNESATMICNASGYPSPSYTWIDLAIPAVILSESSTITIRRDGIYQCTASNVIRSLKYDISTVANVSDCQCHSNCPSCDETAVIVLSVILAISLVINAGLVTWFLCWRLPKERAASGSSSRGPDDNSSRQAAYESTTKPETLAYETLEHATAASAYQELTLEQKSDIGA